MRAEPRRGEAAARLTPGGGCSRSIPVERDEDRVLERSQVVAVNVEEAFAFFADPWNLEAITPPRLRLQIIDAPRGLAWGFVLAYRLPFEPLAGLLAPVTVCRWPAAIFDYRAREVEPRLR